MKQEKNNNIIIRPSYISLFENGELERREKLAWESMAECCLCPHCCITDRLAGQKGFCVTGKYAIVSSAMPHHGEEGPLSGTNGSGTIFFSHCNMACVFCQNWEISADGAGRELTNEELAKIMLALQLEGCHNINLVTPSHIIPHFLSALLIAVENGLNIPVIYNSGGFDTVDSLKLLDGIVDIYLPDMKYGKSKTALRLSGVNDYVKINQAAVLEMHRQVGDLKTNQAGIAYRGLLVRHLVMPGMLDETELILKFLSEKISKSTYTNLMGQYRPCYNANQHPEINIALDIKMFLSAKKLFGKFGLRRNL